MAGPKKREKGGLRASKSDRQPLALREGAMHKQVVSGLPAHWSVFVVVSHTLLCCGLCYGVRCCREWKPSLTAQTLGCIVCHAKAPVRTLSQRDSKVYSGDPDIAHSFTLRLTFSQTSRLPHRRAEGPTPGQAQLLTALLINDC